MFPRMREEPTRSLLLLDANPEERRLISAIAGRSGWSVVGAADEEMALALLQGPHGREVLAALLGGWDADKGPQLIASLRVHRPNLPVIVLSDGDTVSVAVDAMRAGPSDFLVRPVAPERLLEALAANADRRRAAGELAPVSRSSLRSCRWNNWSVPRRNFAHRWQLPPRPRATACRF